MAPHLAPTSRRAPWSASQISQPTSVGCSDNWHTFSDKGSRRERARIRRSGAIDGRQAGHRKCTRIVDLPLVACQDRRSWAWATAALTGVPPGSSAPDRAGAGGQDGRCWPLAARAAIETYAAACHFRGRFTRRRTGIEPADDTTCRPSVLKTGGHQAPGRLRGRRYPRPGGSPHPGIRARRAGATGGASGRALLLTA